VLRTGAFAVRVTGGIEGRAEMLGVAAGSTGRNPEEACRSMPRHPLAGGPAVPRQAQKTAQVWNSLNTRNRRGT
jgi:hypothetical protein